MVRSRFGVLLANRQDFLQRSAATAVPPTENAGKLKILDELRAADAIEPALYYTVRRLVASLPEDLDERDSECLKLVEECLAGKIEWSGLAARFDAIPPPAGRSFEVIEKEREADHKRLASEFFEQAQANDNPEHGREAVAALKHVLRLAPDHTKAKRLLAKIEGYYPPRTQTNSLGMTLVEVRPGRFLMGSPLAESGRGPGELIHAVRIAREFWLGAHEVTRGQFAKFLEATGYRTGPEKNANSEAAQQQPQTGAPAVSEAAGTARTVILRDWRNPGFDQDDQHPVVFVSYDDARAFCRWLSETEGKMYRLPTEAEWEFACRVDSWSPWPWGDAAEGGQGWCNIAGSEARGELGEAAAFPFDDGAVHTNRVGAYRASKWGLFDMTGNVREWCLDYGGAYPALLAEDPRGPERGIARIIRGGSWRSSPAGCRSAAREQNRADFAADDLGFRVVLESPDADKVITP